MKRTATRDPLMVDKDPVIDPQIEELEKIVAPAVDAFLYFGEGAEPSPAPQ